MLNVLLAGAGRGHASAYLNGVLKVNDAKVAGIVDRNLENAEKFAEKNNLAGAYNSFTGLKNAIQIDCIMISSETDMKLDYIQEAVSLGVPVLCDKPVGRSGKEAFEIASICRDADVKLMSGYCLRFAPVAQALKKLVKAGTLGKLVRARATIFRWALTGWYAETSRSGGALMDVGCYLPDLLKFLIGEDPLTVQASGNDDLAVISIEFPSVLATAEMSCRTPEGIRRDLLELDGTSAVAWGDNIGSCWHVSEHGKDVASFEAPPGSPGAYDAMIQEFLACVAEKRPFVPDGRDGVIANSVIDAAHQSIAEKRTIELELPSGQGSYSG